MTREEMLLGGPGLDAYMFNAALYCVECGQDIIAHGPEEIPEPFDQDSEETPQPVFFGESETAWHCEHCGQYLYGGDGEK